jgi:subtilisin family serine protease
VVAAAAAALTGFSGAAAVDALAQPAVAVAAGFGVGDGLTRYVLTSAAGPATPEFLGALDAVEGVDSAQRLHDGSALVATAGVPPQVLRALPGVATVDFSPDVPVAGSVTDPYWPAYGWNLENTGSNAGGQQTARADADVDATDGWSAGTGAGVVVAVVDTGYDADHPDLAGALWTNPDQPCGTVDTDGNGLAGDCHGWNFTTNSADVDNGAGGTHGASVAGVIAARAGNGLGSAGVAPDVTVMPLVAGSGEGINVDLGAQAIRYAADNGATVVNASWGGPTAGPALDRLRAAIGYAESKGVLVVAAAGNDAGDRDRSLVYPASLTEPNVITVGNSTATDAVAPSSGYGATSVDLFAPGTLVFTTWNDGGYRLVSGTSIAAPQVAAAVALYRAASPDASPAQLRAAVLGDVDPLPALTGKSVTGGRLTLSRLAAAPDAVGYRFARMSGPAGVLAPQVTVSAPPAEGDWSVTVGLGMEQSGEIWALADTAVTLDGAELTTDDAGEATFALGDLPTVDQLQLSPTLTLPEGRYVLDVQLHRDGIAVGRTTAAPLLVGDQETDEATPGTGTPGTGTPGTGTGTPDTGTPGTPGTTPGTPGAGTAPGTGTPGAGGPGTGTPPGAELPAVPDAPSGTAPGTVPDTGSTPPDGGGGGGTPPDDGTTTPPGTGTPPGASTPTAPGTGPGSAPTPDTGDGGMPGTGAGSGSGGTGTGPGTGGSTSYPGVGDFQVTEISPSTVGTAGGTEVTITGVGIPSGARVLVGRTAAATVLRSSGTALTFQAPARAAGVYDVSLFSANGAQSSVMTAGLTYVPEATTPGPTTPGTTTPGTTPPAAGTPPGGGSGEAPGTGGGSGPGGAAPASGVGPNGERLVRTAKYASLRSGFWALDCSTSCRGVQV